MKRAQLLTMVVLFSSLTSSLYADHGATSGGGMGPGGGIIGRGSEALEIVRAIEESTLILEGNVSLIEGRDRRMVKRVWKF
jgi:hypothetical protein